jgi:pimeloyl-ACP methyl ester carboxylesterase
VIVETPHVFVEEEALAGIGRAIAAFDAGGFRERLARHHGAGTDTLFRAWSGIWLSPEFRGTPAQVEAVVSGVSGPARSLVLPGCGHAPHAERRDEVLAAAAAFVRETLG